VDFNDRRTAQTATWCARGYEALLAGDSTVFKDATLSDFEADVTPSVPWGGVHRGVEAILANVLPPLAAAIDFGSLRLISISADGRQCRRAVDRPFGGGEEIWLAEYWTLRDGKIGHLRAFYFDARPIVSSLAAAVLVRHRLGIRPWRLTRGDVRDAGCLPRQRLQAWLGSASSSPAGASRSATRRNFCTLPLGCDGEIGDEEDSARDLETRRAHARWCLEVLRGGFRAGAQLYPGVADLAEPSSGTPAVAGALDRRMRFVTPSRPPPGSTSFSATR